MRVSLFRGVAYVAVLGAGFATVACGSSSDDNAPSKAEFVKKADAICKKGSQEINKQAHAFFTSWPPITG